MGGRGGGRRKPGKMRKTWGTFTVHDAVSHFIAGNCSLSFAFEGHPQERQVITFWWGWAMHVEKTGGKKMGCRDAVA